MLSTAFLFRFFVGVVPEDDRLLPRLRTGSSGDFFSATGAASFFSRFFVVVLEEDDEGDL